MENRKAGIKYFLIVFILGLTSVVCAEEVKDTKVAEKLAKEKGLVHPSEFLQWNKDPKDIPSGWIKLDNKYFSVFYPKCFSIDGEEGESDTKISPSILFTRTPLCSLYKKKFGEFNWLSIGYSPYTGISSLKWSKVHYKEVFRQKGYINGVEFNLVGSLMDSFNLETKVHEPQFRWELILICNKKPFAMGYDLPPGKPTMDILNSKLEFSRDFEEIISTFRCK